jgi:hypothetical protein
VKQPLYVLDELPLDPAVIAANRVRSVTGIGRSARADRTAPVIFRRCHAEYDPAGRQTRLEISGDMAGLSRTGIFTPDGRLAKLSYQNPSGQEQYAFEFVYDASGVLTEKKMISGGEIKYRVVAQEIQDGVLLRAVYLDEKGQPLGYDRYHYDHGRLTRLDMGPMGEWIFEYNEQGQLARKTGALASHGPDMEIYAFSYSDKGLLLKMDRLDQDVVEMEYEFFF